MSATQRPSESPSQPGPDRERLERLRIDRGDEARTGRGGRWIGLAAVAVILLLALLGWRLARPTAPRVETARAREARIGGQPAVLNASGYVTARRQATVSSKVTARVMEVLIEEGMEVEEGQVLARLDDANVSAELALARARLGAAESALRETEVRLAEAELELRRTRSLVGAEVASQADLDRAQAQVDSLRARLVREQEERQVAEREVAVEAQNLEDTVIRAPFSGRVVDKAAQPGEMISPVSAGGGFTRTGIGTIVDMGSLEIEVDVNEAYINRVDPGQSVEATLDAYPDWRIPARVIAIVPTADRDKATVRVRIGFDELDPRILPDMAVKVAFLGDEREGQPEESRPLVIPREAVREDAGRDVVLVVRDGRVEQRAVRVGAARGGEVTILAGLAAGERVVTSSSAELADGDRIEEVNR